MLVAEDTESDQLEGFILKEHGMEVEELGRMKDNGKHHRLEINVLNLIDQHPVLARQLFREPAQQIKLMKLAIVKAQKRIQSRWGEGHVLTDVHPRLIGIPYHSMTFFNRIPASEAIGRLIAVRGTVTRVGAVHMIDTIKMFRCSKCGTKVERKADEHQYGRASKPAYCPAIIDDQRCTSIKFDTVQDDAGTYAICCSYQLQFAVPRSISVILQQDLVDSCKAGDDVIIVGWIISRWKPCKFGQRCETEFCLIANNILHGNRTSFAEHHQTKEFAEKFWALHHTCPLYGRNVIVNSFCPQIFGLHLVKLAILLTIIGGCGDSQVNYNEEKSGGARKHRKEGHLLLVGDPGTAKSQFLVAAAKISPRSVMTAGSGTTNAGLTVAAVKEAGSWQLEAGALVLADGGVCCIDEFNSLRAHDRTAIHEAMEQQTLSVAKAGLVCKLSTRCSVIAACNAKGSFEECESISANVALASPLLSRFDLILLMNDRKSVEWDRSLSSSILASSMKSHRSTSRRAEPISAPVDFEQLKTYISMIRTEGLPTMSPGARAVLGKYYQVQRRHDLRDAARTTIRLLESLIRLAQAHAKLMRKDSVEIFDAVWAIVLMETSLATQSILPSRPDLYAAVPEDPMKQYLEYESIILGRLEINPKVVDTTLRLDDEADQILCSWPATLKNLAIVE